MKHSARQCFIISANILNVQPGRNAILNVFAEKYIKCELIVHLVGLKIVDFNSYVQCILYKKNIKLIILFIN